MSSAEKTKGNLKETVGDLVGNDDLEREGKAQKEKADRREDAVDAQEQAKRHDEEAREAEAEQRAQQRAQE